MDIEKLWEILYKERNTASLQELPLNFYDEVGPYIKKLEEEIEAADDKRKELIEDEIRNAKTKVEDIVRRRIGKIIKVASSGVKGMPKGMVEEEKEIFEGVLSCVEEGRKKIIGRILGDKKNKNVPPYGRHLAKQNEEYMVVRILEDIPTFMGTDGRIYNIRKEDVIMLPKANAEIFCCRGIAKFFKKFYEDTKEYADILPFLQ